MHVIRVIVFVTAAISLIVGCHIFVLRTFLRVFPLDNPRFAKLFHTIAIVIAIAAPLSMPFVKLMPNVISKTMFIFAAYWMSFFMNLFVFTFLGSLLVWVIRTSGRSVALKPSFMAVLVLAALVTLVGLWRAAFPKVNYINVKLDKLPPHWQDKKIIHLSDLHLGHIHGNRFMKYVAEKVAAEDPDLIVVTGDLFDGLGGQFEDYLHTINSLKAAKGVFGVIGNHEVYTRESSIAKVLPKTNIEILDNEIRDLDGLQLLGVGYPGLRGKAGEDLLAQFRQKLDKSKPTILLLHLPTSLEIKGKNRAEQQFSTYWYPNTSYETNQSLGVDLQLSGHTHAGQIFPFGHLTTFIYGGFDRGLHVLEDYQIFISSGTGTFGPPIRTAGDSEIVVITLK